MSDDVRKCPACAEEIPLGIEVCPFCSTKIVVSPAPAHDETTELIVLPIKGEGVNLRFGAVIIDVFILNVIYLAGAIAFFLFAHGLNSLYHFDMNTFLAVYGAGTSV